MKLRLAASPDVICEACPHLEAGECRLGPKAETRARRRDLAVLRAIGAVPGARLTAGTIYHRVGLAISPERMRRICAGCEWRELGYCAEGLAALREESHAG